MEVLDTGRVIWVHKAGFKPPLKARNLMERVASRHPSREFVIRWMECGSNCSHGYSHSGIPGATYALIRAKGKHPSRWSQYVRFYASSDEQTNAIVLLHEAAHHIAGLSHRHDEVFYRCLLREAKAEGLLRPVIEYHGKFARSAYRKMRAKATGTSVAA